MFRLSGYHATRTGIDARNTVTLFVADSVAAGCRYCYVLRCKVAGYHAMRTGIDRRAGEKKPRQMAGLKRRGPEPPGFTWPL